MEEVGISNEPKPSKEWLELQEKFVSLCDEQEALYRPDFEKVFKAIYEIDSTQESVYNTNGWNMDCTLPDEANQEIIQKALEKTGFANDEAFCKDFLRYANIIITGKKNMQERAALNIKEEMERCQTKTETNGWNFYPLNIIAPPHLMSIIDDIIQRDGEQGKGLFANNTDIPEENEEEDELLMIDAFGLKCSLLPYWDELKKYKVVGDDGFLKGNFKRELLISINQEVSFVKDNTDKPARIKNHITQKLKVYDEIPVWGIFFQILILQGLCSWLEEVPLNEGDNGYKEAQSLYNWITERLLEKLTRFCLMPFGNGDKQMLKPLCDYLYTTKAGKAIQAHVANKIHGKAGQDKNTQVIEAQSISPEPQPKRPKQQQKGQPARGKGRPKETLKDKMINDADGSKLQKMHTVMNGKKGKDAALIILACIKKGWMPKPTFPQVAEEFGDIGTQQGFTKYLYERWFTKEEIEGAINSLD